MLYGLLNRVALLCASAGLAIATVLTISHASNVPLPCGGSNGCERVAQDPSAMFMGVPVSAIGMAAYFVLIVVAVLRICGVAMRFSSFVGLVGSLIGTIFSAVLTYHAITRIHATCLWCLASGLMMALSVVVYIATPKASLGIKDGAKPISAIPWSLIPIACVAAFAIFGGVTKAPTVDLSSVDLKKADLSELEKSSRPLGNPKAPVTIVEFADLMCPACREMHQRLLLFLVRNKGRVRLLYHPFPLKGVEGHEDSTYAAELSEQLNLDNFWGFVGKVYSSEDKPDRPALDRFFAGFKGKRIRTAKQAADQVDLDRKIGIAIGVKETPTYILFIGSKPDAVASSVDLQKVILRPEFAKIFTAPAKR